MKRKCEEDEVQRGEGISWRRNVVKRKSNPIVEKECCEDEVPTLSWRRNVVKRKSNPIVEKECCEDEVQRYRGAGML